MKKRVLALFLAIMFSVMGVLIETQDVKAEDVVEEDVEFSTLLTEDALIGYGESQTWGVYLMNGYSVINDAGGGRIGCGGITNAARTCKVSVNAVVERYMSGSWVRVTSFSKTDESAVTVSASKYLYVASGYYYRVRSTHYAASEVSDSCTNGLWM